MARFLTSSDGQVVANPRFLAASAEVIVNLERRKEIDADFNGARNIHARAGLGSDQATTAA